MPDYQPTLAPLAFGDTTAEDRKRQARIAEALLMQGAETAPIQSWTQGAARLANALVGGYMAGDVRRQGQAEEARTQAILAGLPSLQGAGTPPAAMPQRQAEIESPAAPPAAPAPRPAMDPRAMGIAALSDPGVMASKPGVNRVLDISTAVPTGYTLPTDRAKVASTDRVVGDDEGVRLGYYDAPKTAGARPPNQPDVAALTSPALPGATPVQTQSIQPPAQMAQAAPPGMASRADVIPPAIQAEMRLGQALAANRPTRDAGLAMYRAALEKAQAWQASQLPSVRDVDPDKPPMIYDPRTQTMKPVPGFATEKPATVEGPKGPVPIPPNLSPKERKVFVDNVLQNTADVRSGKLTESQSKDVLFSGRMLGATKQFTPDIEAEGLSLGGKAASKAPYDLGKYVQNEKRQAYDSLQFQWISGALRKESGAAIQPWEWDKYDRTFFPQPGEAPKVVEMKRQARALADDLMQKGVPVDIEAAVRERMPGLPSVAGTPSTPINKPGKAINIDINGRIIP